MSMDELRAKSRSSAKKGYDPVVIEGRKIAVTWWGIGWCQNLESYADYESRLPRGSRYVRSGSVIDLKITEGHITGKVQGSSRTPYRVTIDIAPLSPDKWENILVRCGNSIESLDSLLSGEFPKEFEVLFTNPQYGLFPTPREIDIDCNCPDWANLCKHAAAVLYGVGHRLDKNPLLFFLLRGIDFNQLLQKTIEEKTDLMFKNIGVKSKRTIDEKKAKKLFGF